MITRKMFLGYIALGLPLASCTTAPPPPPEVHLDSKKIKNLNDLVIEIKKGAGKLMPENTSLEAIYKEIAKAFVDNVEQAIEAGVRIPGQIIDMLPYKKKKVIAPLVAVPIVGGSVATMSFTLWGVFFYIPIATFFAAVLGSLLVMMAFIVGVIQALTGEPKNPKKKMNMSI